MAVRACVDGKWILEWLVWCVCHWQIPSNGSSQMSAPKKSRTEIVPCGFVHLFRSVFRLHSSTLRLKRTIICWDCIQIWQTNNRTGTRTHPCEHCTRNVIHFDSYDFSSTKTSLTSTSNSECSCISNFCGKRNIRERKIQVCLFFSAIIYSIFTLDDCHF